MGEVYSAPKTSLLNLRGEEKKSIGKGMGGT